MNLLQSAFRANLDGNNNNNNNLNNNDDDNSDQKQQVIRKYAANKDIYTQIKSPRDIHLSETALNEFIANQCDFPIILKISNEQNNITTHVAVAEFSYNFVSKALLPEIIMNQLKLKHGQQIKCIYVQLLPATKLIFEADNHEELLKQNSYMKHIRQEIGKYKCLSINDTISMAVNDKQFDLKVKNVSPENEHSAVSLTNVQYSVDIEIESTKPVNQENINKKSNDKINQNNNQQNDKNNNCPIVSSISSTKGAPPSQQQDDNDNDEEPVYHTKGGPFNNNNNIENVAETEDEDDDDGVLLDNNGNHTMGGGNNNDNIDNDYEFEDDEEDGWGPSANEQHSDWDYDGQDYIPIQNKEFTPPINGRQIVNIEDEEELVRDPNSTSDGNSMCNRPSRIKNVEHRAWICEHCHAINNLIDSMKRNYKCNCCAGRYRPGQKLIESAEQDMPEAEQKIYTVWICACTWSNDITWRNCSLCGTKKPKEGLNSFQTTEEPKISGNNNNQDPLVVGNNDQYGNAIANPNGGGNGRRNNNLPKNWYCTKCFQRNGATSNYCTGCNKHRWTDNQYNGQDDDDEINEYQHERIRRQRYYGNMRPMGAIKAKQDYPVFGEVRRTKMNKRLIDIFGTTYRNDCIAGVIDSKLKNAWNKDEKLGNGLLKIACKHALLEPYQYSKPLGPRAISMNERNGYIAILTQQDILIIKPSGTCSFEIDTVYNIPIKQRIDHGWLTAELCRIRFIDHNIYVFHYDKHTIYRYDYDINSHCITYISEIYDKYFTEAKITDIMVTNKLLIVLFDRWLGVYKLYPSLEWYHAVAFSKSDNINIRSLEMSIYDDWEDRLPIEKECYFIDSQEKAVKFWEIEQEQRKIEEDEKRAQEEKDEVLDDDDDEAAGGYFGDYKESIKNYIFINCENHIIAIHPTNPTFDFLSVAGNIRNGQSYCMSRKYGAFWCGNEGDRIIQSSKYDENQPNIVCEVGKDSKFEWKDFRMLPLMHNDKLNDKQTKLSHKDIKTFNSCLYDESYGISGRLLTQCTVSYNDKELEMFYQLFNQNELLPLKQELEREDYFLMPGTNTKPFNLIVYVFEMLYGTDLIDLLLISPDFNLVYALPGNEEDEVGDDNKDEKEEVDEEEEEEKGIKNYNDLLVSGSKCLIRNKENKWCNGVVLTVIPPDDAQDDGPGKIGEMLQIAYIESLQDGTEIEEKTLIARYDARLKYNESIPLVDKIKLHKEQWNAGDKCIYWLQLTSTWCPAEVIELFKKDKVQYIKFKYLDELQDKYVETEMKYEDAALNLNKLEDVVNKDDDEEEDAGYDGDNMELENEEKGGDGGVDGNADQIAMMKLLPEGPMDQSYIAIKAIGNEKAEKDEDLIENEGGDAGVVFVPDGDEIDMEIEQEGVNEINNQ